MNAQVFEYMKKISSDFLRIRCRCAAALESESTFFLSPELLTSHFPCLTKSQEKNYRFSRNITQTLVTLALSKCGFNLNFMMSVDFSAQPFDLSLWNFQNRK